MAKRKSQEPLDVGPDDITPPSKKVHVEEPIDQNLPNHKAATNGVQTVNGYGPILDGRDEPVQEANGRTDYDASTTEDEEGATAEPLRQAVPTEGYRDLYLDTIHRQILDFDFEKLCSVTLSNINVYACLVCGKYFQGRGPKSHAYLHALEADHHVYINMETKKVYILPEGYEVQNRSLEDIKYVVDPKFSERDVKMLDREPHESIDLSNKRYRPGFIGMNNIKANDYLNVVVQTLAHVAPLRNFFLLHAFPQGSPQLPVRFSTLVRKIWNPKAFRNHVSPHELLQEIAIRSSKRFTLTEQSDPVEFLSWFLNNLHLSLGGSKTKMQSSIIQKTFQGKLSLESQAITARSDASADRLRFEESSSIITNTTPYTVLTLDLPPTPLFRDAIESKNIIPQVPLTTLLQKYSGLHPTERQSHRIRHRLLHPLPPYLLFHVKRFSTNKFVSERNPTIVTFPSPRGLDMSPYVQPDPKIHPLGEPLFYELVANIILDATGGRSGGEDSNAADAANKAVGGAGEKIQWKVQVRDKAAARDNHGGKLPEWMEIQDLWVQRTEAETLFTREGYLMVWERRRDGRGKSNAKAGV